MQEIAVDDAATPTPARGAGRRFRIFTKLVRSAIDKPSGNDAAQLAGAKWLSEPKKLRLGARRRASVTDAPPYAERKAIAIAINHTNRCMKAVPNPSDGIYINPATGQRCDLERLPFFRWQRAPNIMWEHGCSVSVSLLMRFLLEASLVCMLLFAISLPQAVENYSRNMLRVECRTWWVENASYAAFPTAARPQRRDRRVELDAADSYDAYDEDDAAAATSQAAAAERTVHLVGLNTAACGYSYFDIDHSSPPSNAKANGGSDGDATARRLQRSSGGDSFGETAADADVIYLPIRPGLPTISWYLWPARGSCEEYTNETTVIVPTPSTPLTPHPFVGASQARWCRGGGGARLGIDWLASLGSTLCVLLFITRLRWLMRTQTRASDLERYEPQDYAVQLSGLPLLAEAPLRGREPSAGDVVEGADFTEAKPPSWLSSQIATELDQLGFASDDVVHIEVATDCCREAELLEKLDKVRVRRKELRAKIQAKLGATSPTATPRAAPRDGLAVSDKPSTVGARAGSDGGHAPSTDGSEAAAPAGIDVGGTAGMEEQLVACDTLIAELSTSLATLEHVCHTTTGHAFISFRTQVVRNRFLRLVRMKGAAVSVQGKATALVQGSVISLLMRAVSRVGAGAASDVTAGALEEGSTRDAERTATATKTRSADRSTSPKLSAVGSTQALSALASLPVLGHARARVAPDPSTINWTNLECPPSESQRRRALSWGVSFLLVVLNFAAILSIKLTQRTDEYGESIEGVGGLMLNTVISVAIITVNLVLKIVSRMMIKKERHASREVEQLAMFRRLTLMYMLNAVLAPLFIFSYPLMLTQGWYEDGGVAENILTLIYSDAFGSFMRILQPPPLLKRFVLAPLTAHSQPQTNLMWAPEDMFVGELYANAMKTFAVAIVYQPLWPTAPLLVPLGLLAAYGCFNFAIVFWWRPPPQLSDEMLSRMVYMIGGLMAVRFVVEYMVESKARPELGDTPDAALLAASDAARTAVQFGVLGLYFLLPLERWMPSLRRYRQEELTTDPTPYDDVAKSTGVALARYECPALGRARTAAELERAHQTSSLSTAMGLELYVATPGKPQLRRPVAPEEVQMT